MKGLDAGETYFVRVNGSRVRFHHTQAEAEAGIWPIPIELDDEAAIEVSRCTRAMLFVHPRVAVDAVADTLDLGCGHGLETGDRLRFMDPSTIGSVAARVAYYVSVVDGEPTKMRLHPTAADASARTHPVDLRIDGSVEMETTPRDADARSWAEGVLLGA